MTSLTRWPAANQNYIRAVVAALATNLATLMEHKLDSRLTRSLNRPRVRARTPKMDYIPKRPV